MKYTTVIACEQREQSNPVHFKWFGWIASSQTAPRNDSIALWLVVAVLLALVNPAHAQVVTTPRTDTRLITDLATVTPGRPLWAVLHIKLKEGWHTYWKNPGDSGTSPILKWTLPSGFTAGEIEYIGPERLPAGPLMDYGYHNDAYYLIPIKPPSLVNENATIILMLKAQWLVCSKDVCIPEKADLSLALPVTPSHMDPKPTADALLIADLVKKLPTPLADPVAFQAADGMVHFNVKLPKIIEGTPKSVEFYPVLDGVISNIAEQKADVQGDTISFSIKQAEGAEVSQWQGVVSITEKNGNRKDYAVSLQKGEVNTVVGSDKTQQPSLSRSSTGNVSLGTAVLFALLGGLILNLMPCVLPILSLKVLSIAKKAKSHSSQVRKQAFAYTAGVVLSFMLLAMLLLALQNLAGETLGWGFQMQSPVFVSLLAVLMFMVGLNLSGAFELPVLFGNAGGEKASEDSTSGSFLTGVLAVLVATPCTAPFMAPAIGFALTQGTQVVLMVFAALGVGLAAPFLLLSLFPSLVSLLPRPGAWMITLRQFLAFPIYLTVVWLLWIVAGEAGPTGIGIAMLGMVLAGFCIFLLHRNSWLAKLFALLLAVAGVVCMVQSITPVKSSSALPTELTEPYSASRLAELRAKGKPVFVDATAEWCITCKVNEAVALDKPEVKAVFKERNIIMMIADWTHGDAEITKYLQSFDRSGVPIYVYYPPQGEPKVLPQILTPSIVLDAIAEAPKS